MFIAHYRECLGPRERGEELGVKDKGLWDVHSPLYRLPPKGKGGWGHELGVKDK